MGYKIQTDRLLQIIAESIQTETSSEERRPKYQAIDEDLNEEALEKLIREELEEFLANNRSK